MGLNEGKAAALPHHRKAAGDASWTKGISGTSRWKQTPVRIHNMLDRLIMPCGWECPTARGARGNFWSNCSPDKWLGMNRLSTFKLVFRLFSPQAEVQHTAQLNPNWIYHFGFQRLLKWDNQNQAQFCSPPGGGRVSLFTSPPSENSFLLFKLNKCTIFTSLSNFLK